ncbi:hypothetical protein [Salegentibacter salarius]|uniref:Outer membrane protein beta-barrel domain-containing protein n=1 Tax=Salegentibacter salarius TaxID=435906 RepID=A0A2N0TNI4_9FLAO|nr:hypothetical protein [Salegentibacter salarius]OEY71490.1 hypothetical protein BHS39_04995 [Salegentibacter salarius]PKD16280.1 hypothetical protein APR40_04995 [Salegentibacter salarius]SLJ89842.1 hypothetical protein SAMN05660445_00891 [Salegentibacter salarius]
MKNKKTLILIVIIFTSSSVNKIQGQEESFTNPVAFLEIFIGPYGGENKGVLLGSEMNYQWNKNLMTLRYSSLQESGDSKLLKQTTNANTDELALLYGLRKINNSHSLSGSAGLSYNVYKSNSRNENNEIRDRFIGLALEANIKWFKYKTDSPFNVGFGLKLSGNISKNSYVGLSAVLSLGWHKIYEERIDPDDSEDED